MTHPLREEPKGRVQSGPTDKLRVLDLFAGLGGWSQAFREAGHEVVTLDNNPSFLANLIWDVLKTDPKDLPGPFDVILASPPCEAFSVAGHFKDFHPTTREPVTERGAMFIRLARWAKEVVDYWQPRVWVIENPRGLMRKIKPFDTLPKATVSYCQYGEKWMKPTDLWTNLPAGTFKPMCKNGDPCHEPAPRGSKTGLQGIGGGGSSARRAKVPYALSVAVLEASRSQPVFVSCNLAGCAAEATTVKELQESAFELLDRMIAVAKDGVAKRA